MGTKIYGASDDLIEFEGDFHGETDGGNDPRLLVISDGTLLEVKYGKVTDGGIWEVKVVHQGSLFERLEICNDSEAEIYSDVAHFKNGVRWVLSASAWDRVK